MRGSCLQQCSSGSRSDRSQGTVPVFAVVRICSSEKAIFGAKMAMFLGSKGTGTSFNLRARTEYRGTDRKMSQSPAVCRNFV